MTGLDLGPLRRASEKATGFRFQPTVDLSQLEQDFDIDQPTEYANQRLEQMLGSERYGHARVLEQSMKLGLRPDDFTGADKEVFDAYVSAATTVATDLMVASKIAQTTRAEDWLRMPATFATSATQVPVDLTYQAGSLLSLPIEMMGGPEEAIPRAFNWLVGLGSDQSSTPDVMAYAQAQGRVSREAFDEGVEASTRRKLAEVLADTEADPDQRRRAQARLDELNRSTKPEAETDLVDAYRQQVLSNQFRRDSLPMAQRVAEGAAGVVGTVKGLFTGGVNKAFTAAEGKVGLTGLSERLLAKAAASKGVQKALPLYLGGLTSKVATRFGLAEFSRTGPEGERMAMSEQALNGAITLATMPVFAGVSWAAERAQRWIGGESSALTAAFKRFTGNVSTEAKARWMASGKFDESLAFREFVDMGMPGLQTNVARRVFGLGTRAMLEGMSFSPTDRAFWHDLSDAVADGDEGAAQRVLEAMLTNSLAWGVMSGNGLRNHVDREVVRKLGLSLGADPFASPEPPKTVMDRAQEVVRDEGLEISEPDPHLRTWKLLEAKLALDGIGEPVADGVVLAYDGESSPRLVRYRDGEYESRPLYEGDWAPAPEFRGELMGPDAPTIPEQAEITGRIANRILHDPTTKLDPTQQRLVAKALEVASRARAEDNPGVAAALLLAETYSPQTWGTDQFGTFVQLVLRGDTPNAVATLVDAFVTPEAYRVESVFGKQEPGKAPKVVYDPRTGGSPRVDPATGLPIDEGTGMPREQAPRKGYEGLVEGRRAKGTPRPAGGDPIDPTTGRPYERAPLEGYEGAESGQPGPKPKAADGGVDLAPQTPEAKSGYEEALVGRGSPRPKAGDGGVDLAPQTPEPISGYEGVEVQARGPRPKPGEGFTVDPASGEVTIDTPAKAPAKGKQAGSGDWLERRPESVLREIARATGTEIQDGASREQIIAALRKMGVDDPQAGGVSPAVMAAVTGLGLLGLGIATGGIASVGQIVGTAALAATPLLAKWTGKQFHRLLEQHGPVDLARKISGGMVRVAQETLRIGGSFARTANTLMWLTNNQIVDMRRSGRLERLVIAASVLGGAYFGPSLFDFPGATALGLAGGSALGVGAALGITHARGGTEKAMEARRANQSLSAVATTDIKGMPGAQYGVTKARQYGDGWIKSLAGLSGMERKIIRLLTKLGDQVAEAASQAGMLFRGGSGELRDTATLKGIRRIPSYFTQTYYKMLREPGSKLAKAYIAAIAQLNDLSIEVVEKMMDFAEPGAPKTSGDHRTIGVENARRFRYLPDSIILDGIEHRMLESKPYEIALAAMTRTAARIAYHRVFGSELSGEELEANPRTPEQQALRDAMEQYVAQAQDRVKAHELLTRVQRAANHLPAYDRLTSPGSVWDQVYHGIARPARSLWAAAKLSAAFVLNLPEPLGTPAAYTSMPTVARELAGTWWLAATDPKGFARELGRLRQRGFVSDQVPNFLAVEREAGRFANAGERLSHAMNFFMAPMRFVNTINAVAVARAGEALVAEWRATPLPEALRPGMREKLRQAGVEDPALIERMLDGKASEAEYDGWIGNLRRYTMGERLPVEQAATQLIPITRETTPFQAYASNNLRVLMDASTALMDSLPTAENRAKFSPAERRAKRAFFWKLAGSKALAHGIGLSAMYYWMYGSAATQMFVGEDETFDWDEAINRYAKFVFNAEMSGFAVSTASRALSDPRQSGIMDLVSDYARTVPFIDMLVTLDEAVQTEGRFLDRAKATGIDGLAQKILIMFEDMTPLARHVRTWAEDPEMAAAIRRYYEILPVPGRATKLEYSEWSSAMRRFRTKLRARIMHPETWDEDSMWSLLEEAAAAGTQGWRSVQDSLKDRRLLVGLSEEEMAKLEATMSPRFLDRIREHDQALDYFAKRVAARR